MKPFVRIDSAETPDGIEMVLLRRGDELVIRVGHDELMTSVQTGSEEELARLGCAKARVLRAPRVLIGGLGMGFTLRSALDVLPEDAEVVVAELMPCVVEWNRDGPLGELADSPLEDPRVRVEMGDVAALMRKSKGVFDAILLDVDNGPIALTAQSNAAIYEQRGLREAHAALRPKGVLTVWSSAPDARFSSRLETVGFAVEACVVKSRGRHGSCRHTIWICTRT